MPAMRQDLFYGNCKGWKRSAAVPCLLGNYLRKNDNKKEVGRDST